MAADQHLGLRQHQLAKRLEVGLLLVFLDESEVRQVGHQRHVGIVGEDFGDRADTFGRAEKTDLPGSDGDVLENAARLLDDDVGLDRMVVEDLGGVAHDDARHDRERMRAHRGDRRHVAGRAAGAARIADVEAHHAGRRGLFGRTFGVGLCSGRDGSHGVLVSREESRRHKARSDL